MYIRHTELTEMKSHRMMRQNWILLVVFTAVVTSQALGKACNFCILNLTQSLNNDNILLFISGNLD